MLIARYERGGYDVANAHRGGWSILQSGNECEADDSCRPRAMSKIINDQHGAHRIVSPSVVAHRTVHGVRPHRPLKRSVTRWIPSCGRFDVFFFVLSALVDILARTAARRTASRRTCTRIHLAKAFYACLLQDIGASQQVSRVRRARWRSRAVEPGPCHPSP